MSELAVIATGSFLDFMLETYEFSVPVGRIHYLHLEPMSFEEFLKAIEQDKLCDFLENYDLSDEILPYLHEKLWNYLREYMFIGGLPFAVKNWAETKSLIQVSEIQQNLLATYRDDFAKYNKRMSQERLDEVFRAIPRLLGKKFKYSFVNKDIQSLSIKNALNLLCKARICHKVQATSADGIPLSASIKENIFKVIFLDIGLVLANMGLSLNELIKLDDMRLINEGGLAEQLTGQLLRCAFPDFMEPNLYYWLNEKAGSEAEIDYLIQKNAQIIPIEVKASSTGSLRSLHAFMKLRGLNKALRFNHNTPSTTQINVKNHAGQTINYELLSLPLYLIEQAHRLV